MKNFETQLKGTPLLLNARFSKKELVQLSEVRGLLEASAVKWATERAEDVELYDLMAMVEDDYLKISYQIVECRIAFWEHDIKFHKAIIKLSRNKQLLAIYQRFYGMIAQSTIKVISFAGRPEQALDEHMDIVRLMVHRKGDLAAKAMRNHITETFFN